MASEQMLSQIREKRKLSKDRIVVGSLNDAVVAFLEERGIPVYTKEIYLNHKGLSHLSRQSKRQRGAGLDDKDILKIQSIVKTPSALFIEHTKRKLNLLYCDYNCHKCIKIVVDTKYIYKGEKMTLIKTAGYIKPSDLNNPTVELAFGEWKF